MKFDLRLLKTMFIFAKIIHKFTMCMFILERERDRERDLKVPLPKSLENEFLLNRQILSLISPKLYRICECHFTQKPF